MTRVDRLRVRPGQRVRLDEWDPDGTDVEGGGKRRAEEQQAELRRRLEGLQELLFATRRHQVLVVLQGMDSAGKDGTIRRVFEGVNPQGVRVASFKEPTPTELAHDFLWRIHAATPAAGEIAIFDRSHYEDVLIVRVHGLEPKDVWEERYRAINEFERNLANEGTSVLKFFLHIDRAEQGRRLRERLDDPTKHWKFSFSDPRERRFWPRYMEAYREAIERTSTRWAPWYIIPSNHRWLRDLLVTRVLVETLEGFRMRYPALPRGARAAFGR